MADDQITQMVNDPDFGKLSPTEQRKALAAHDPAFGKASDEVISQFVSAHHSQGLQLPDVNAQAKAYGTRMLGAEADQPTTQSTPYGLVVNEPISPESKALKRTAEQGTLIDQAPMLAATAASGGTAEMGVLARLGASAMAAGGTKAATGGTQDDVAESVALNSIIPELGGQAVTSTAKAAANASGPALARVLRLTPKSVQFGREPAQEVLERGLAKGSLPEIKASIENASKQVTSDLNAALKGTKGTVNAENLSLDVANQMGGTAGNRFLKIVDDAADKLGLRTNQLSNLSAADANALKQEVARQAKFVEGDMRPSIANGGKIFGGKLKDELIKLNPEVRPLLESSANLTEASKGADYAVRAEKVGQGKGLLGGVQLNKPGTYVRAVTDRPSAPQLLYKIANNLKDHTPISNALRAAFSLVYGNQGEEIQP